MILTVFADNVVDDLRASVLAEIDIKIGHTDTLRIEKALKQQIVFDGIDARDADAISAQRAGARASAGTYGDIFAFGILYEIIDDQEVIDKSHLFDNGQLIIESLYQALIGILSVMAIQSVIA